jgi:hypothetical protein
VDLVEKTIQSALDTARAKLTELVNARGRIDKEIIEWKRVVDSLSAVSETVSEDVPSDIGLAELAPVLRLKFTDAIRDILKTADGYVTAPQIRDQLIRMGFDFSKYKQELVPVHNTLKRLQDQGEVSARRDFRDTQGGTQSGTVSYRWITPLARALADPVEDSLQGALASDHPVRKLATGVKFPKNSGADAGTYGFPEGHPVRIAQDHDNKK